MCCFICIQAWISFMAISVRCILCCLNSTMHPKLKSSICKLIVSYFKSLFDLKVNVKVEQSTMLYIIVKWFCLLKNCVQLFHIYWYIMLHSFSNIQFEWPFTFYILVWMRSYTPKTLRSMKKWVKLIEQINENIEWHIAQK